MIYFDRGDEPPELVRVRDQRLALAQLDGRPDTITGYDLDAVTRALLEAQGYRCAYCGKPAEEKQDPIEHIRPKAAADGIDWGKAAPPDELDAFYDWFEQAKDWKVRDSARYWWLSWTWENLVYVCGVCNTGWKLNWFPCERASTPLGARRAPPGSERPLLVDPSREDPLDHLRFAPDLATVEDEHDMGWGPVPLTERGRWTIAVLGLHRRQGLRTTWKIRAREIVGDPDVRAARSAIAESDFTAARSAWDRARARLLDATPAPDYLALRWCVFDHLVPEDVRNRAEPPLALPRPRTVETRTPLPLEAPRPELDVFSAALRVRIRAVGPRMNDASRMNELLCEMCSESPRTTAELADLLRRDDAASLEQTWLSGLADATPPRLVRGADGRWSVPRQLAGAPDPAR